MITLIYIFSSFSLHVETEVEGKTKGADQEWILEKWEMVDVWGWDPLMINAAAALKRFIPKKVKSFDSHLPITGNGATGRSRSANIPGSSAVRDTLLSSEGALDMRDYYNEL